VIIVKFCSKIRVERKRFNIEQLNEMKKDFMWVNAYVDDSMTNELINKN